MKLSLLLVVLCLGVSCCIFAQTIGSDNKTFETPQHIWLQSSKGKIVSSGDTVSRDFFKAKWVTVQGSRPFKKDEFIVGVIQPVKGTAIAYRFNDNALSAEALKRLSTEDRGAKITFVITKAESNKPSGAFYALQIVLK